MYLSSINGTVVTPDLTLYSTTTRVSKTVVSIFGCLMLSYFLCNWHFRVLEEV
jgi:hypothetical protein